jgi:hypothetical protein
VPPPNHHDKGSAPEAEPLPLDHPLDEDSSADPEPVPLPEPRQGNPEEHKDLTVVDRYYLAWDEFRQQQGREPKDSELSEFLARRNITNRSGGRISPSTLRRYFLEFRIYGQWARRCAQDGTSPTAAAVAQDLAKLGITGQYSQPIAEDAVKKLVPDFERRYAALNGTPAYNSA